MGIYAARRLLLGGVPLLVFLATLTFVVMHAVPGGPWDREKPLPMATRVNLDRIYHLDDPLPEQYGRFLLGLARGDLGVSFVHRNTAVTDLLQRGVRASALLGLSALVLALPGGVALGAAAARRPGGGWDYASLAVAVAGSAVPAFVVALLALLLFAVQLRWLPATGWGGPEHLFLPALALTLLPLAYVTRVTRAAVREVLAAPYVLAAAARGLSGRMLLFRHVLPNALGAPLLILGPLAADLVAGAFLVESIFGIPGVGRLLVQAVFQRDYGVIMGVTVFYAALVVAANLAVDLLHAAIDPRVRRRLVTPA